MAGGAEAADGASRRTDFAEMNSSGDADGAIPIAAYRLVAWRTNVNI